MGIHLQVANFGTAEDDGSFWSRWIKPDAVSQAAVWSCSVIFFLLLINDVSKFHTSCIRIRYFLLLHKMIIFYYFLSQEALVPRATRNTKSYAEAAQPDRSNKRKKKESEPQERVQKRRKPDHSVPSAPMIDGTSAQVRGWSFGNVSKRDALRFSRAVCSYLFTHTSMFGLPSMLIFCFTLANTQIWSGTKTYYSYPLRENRHTHTHPHNNTQ